MEIARLCKYLPENDLKVSPAGAGALLAGFAPSGSGAPAGPPFLSPRDPRRHPVLSRPGGGPNAGRSDPVRPGVTRRAGGARVSRMLSQFPPWGSQGMSRSQPQGCPSWPSGYPRTLSPDSFAWRTPLRLLRPRSPGGRPSPPDSALGMGSSSRGGDRNAGWPASDRRCRRLPEPCGRGRRWARAVW